MESVMKPEEASVSGTERPTIWGTGLLALDILWGEAAGSGPVAFAGGTCCNVLTILTSFGWNAFPIGRLGDDSAGQMLIADLVRCGVRADAIEQSDSVGTPIVVEIVNKNNGNGHAHRFIMRCPACGTWLPSYRPTPRRNMRNLSTGLPSPRVFFFDRLSRGAVDTAISCAERGAIVVFEPSANGNGHLLHEAVSAAHIIKYASDRAKGRFVNGLPSEVLLEVETLGSEGLRFRGTAAGKKNWHILKASQLNRFRDAAGAGDWCSAGIINRLCCDGAQGIEAWNEDRIIEALRFGQELAAWNCGFSGARGGMYVRENNIQPNPGSMARAITPAAKTQIPQDVLNSACPGCRAVAVAI
jgi:fructokinase